MNKEKILEVLKNQSDYISGQKICEELGISRTAVWKNIKHLKEEGYKIDSISNKGYLLITAPDSISRLEIQNGLNTNLLGRVIHSYKIIDSTNLEAKRLADKGAKAGTVIIAEQQTNGKGRRGRIWISPPNTGI